MKLKKKFSNKKIAIKRMGKITKLKRGWNCK